MHLAPHTRRWACLGLAVLLGFLPARRARAQDCLPPLNPISCENARPGSPPSEWDVPGAGDASLVGFATSMSVAPGDTVRFKIRTTLAAYRVDLYRLGWYGGLGARKVGTTTPTALLPQLQSPCLYDSATHLVDCGNWQESAAWPVPPDAISGVYLARLTGQGGDAGRASLILFVVRDDTSHSDLLFQTSDATWQAYNPWGETNAYLGYSLYEGPEGKASKVSYNRPFFNRSFRAENFFFNAEYPMVRWLERNGYDVRYCASFDPEAHPQTLQQHRAFLSVGHDEYWSGPQRAAVEAARDSGVNLAFFSGDEVYWKTRWEPSLDSSAAAGRTLVCYKEGYLGGGQGGKLDPLANVWTGLWRDGCSYSPPADGCQPEQLLTGQLGFSPGSTSLRVPATFARARLWSHTAVESLPAGGEYVAPFGTLGFEWDPMQFGYAYPVTRAGLSLSSYNGWQHQVALLRSPPGNLVFGAGTPQWSWGLDATHDRAGSATSPVLQQATRNVFSWMGANPATADPGLDLSPPDTERVPPVCSIDFPSPGAEVMVGHSLTLRGSASDAHGMVSRVQVSVDGGVSWQDASGTSSWIYPWTSYAPGVFELRARALDDLGNLDSVGVTRMVQVNAAPPAVCPCSIWNLETGLKFSELRTDSTATETGLRVEPGEDGTISAVRFYKVPGDSGSHQARVYDFAGQLLASADFAGESAFGWQEATLVPRLPVLSGELYTLSVYRSLPLSVRSPGYFSTRTIVKGPWSVFRDGIAGPNGVVNTNPAGGFPTESAGGANFWVDAVFMRASAPAPLPGRFRDLGVKSFGAGAPGPGAWVGSEEDGDVRLAPAQGQEWEGPGFPAEFTFTPQNPAGRATFVGGSLRLDAGSAFGTGWAPLADGQRLECDATFFSGGTQWLGLATSRGDSLAPGIPYAIFRLDAFGSLHAISSDGATLRDDFAAAQVTRIQHRLRLDRHPGRVDFYVDGSIVASHPLPVAALRPHAADARFDSAGLELNSMRTLPYASSGTYLSRVSDPGAPVLWSRSRTETDLPSGTSLSLEFRTGFTAVPDSTWSAFQVLGVPDGAPMAWGRYAQYRVSLASSDPWSTPRLLQLLLEGQPAPTPAALAGFAVVKDTSAAPDSTFGLSVRWTGDRSADSLEVWRARAVDAPRYPGGTAALPTAVASYPPPPPWALTPVRDSGAVDTAGSRNFYSYVAYARAPGGGRLLVTAVPARALNYRVSDGTGPFGVPEGAVDSLDLGRLLAHYHERAPLDSLAWLDFGPTDTRNPAGLPLPDSVVDFEELMLLARQWSTGAPPVATTRPGRAAPRAFTVSTARPRLEAPVAVQPGIPVRIRIRWDGAAAMAGVSLQLHWDSTVVRLLTSEVPAWVRDQRVCVVEPGPGALDLAQLAPSPGGLLGQGELVGYTFDPLASGDPVFSLQVLKMRDPLNQSLLADLPVGVPGAAPTQLRVSPARPNPARGQTSLVLELPARTDVQARVLSVDGRRVRTLERGLLEPGRHVLTWDGLDASGQRVPSGVFFIQLHAGPQQFTRRVVVLR